MKTQFTVLAAVALFTNAAFGSACRPSKPSSSSSSTLSSSASSSASSSPSSSPSPLPCGSNILTNGDFSAGAKGWTVGDGASISSEADCGTDFNGDSIPVCGDVKLTTGSLGSSSGTARLSQTLLIGTANLGHTVFFSIRYQQPTAGSLYCGISANANGESPGVSFSQTVNDPSEGGQWQGFSGSCVATAATMELTCTLTVTGGSQSTTSALVEALLADVSVEVLC